MRTRSLTGMLVLLLTAGCGGGDPDADVVAWTDRVCGALAGFTETATAQPTLDATDPQAAVTGLGTYLASTATAVDASISALEAAGPSPVAGGDEYVARLTGTLTQIRAGFESARTQLDGIDTSSTRSVSTALPAVVAPLQELGNLANPTDGLQANDELRAAADRAPNCRRLGVASG